MGLASNKGGVAGKVGGGVSLAGGTLLGLSKTSASDLFSGKASPLGKLAGAIAGVGSFVTGIAQGGASGVLQTTLGGAEFGAAVGGPLGAAIGAGVGLVAGGIRALFGGKSKQQKIAEALTKQTLDPSVFSGNAFIGQEFDRAAQSTFASTVGSTFSEGPGGVFSTNSVNGSRTPVNFTYAPSVQAFDSNGVQAVLNTHGTTIAQAISGRVLASNSGLGRAVRTAVAPA